MDLIDKFIADLEKTFHVKQEKISLAAKWKESAPEEVRGSTIEDYLKNVSTSNHSYGCVAFAVINMIQVGLNSFCYGVYHVLDSFRAEYDSTFHKKPYVNPVTRWRWCIPLLQNNCLH